MRRESKAERAAWSEYFGDKVAKDSKYANERAGKYASIHEEQVARNLWVLADRGIITDLQEQVRFLLVPGDGKLRPITYIADFVWTEDGKRVIADAKGFKTAIYRIKKKLLKLLHGLEIREL